MDLSLRLDNTDVGARELKAIVNGKRVVQDEKKVIKKRNERLRILQRRERGIKGPV